MEQREFSSEAAEYPRIFPSFVAGFDSITRNWWVMLFPVALDVLLWLGPHVQVNSFLQRWWERSLQLFASMPDTADLQAALGEVQPLWQEFALRLNLLAALRTFPVGIPSLMASLMPLKTPWGAPPFLDLGSIGVALLVVLGGTLLGLLLGAVYFWSVGRAVVAAPLKPPAGGRDFVRALVNLVALAVLWMLFVFGMSIPMSFISPLVMLFGEGVGMLALLMGLGVLLWICLPLVFVPHGVIVHRLNLWQAARRSITVVRYTFPATVIFLLGAVFTSLSMDALWRVPPEDSWLMLISVWGHAFVVSGLLAGSFVFYFRADRWVGAMLRARQDTAIVDR